MKKLVTLIQLLIPLTLWASPDVPLSAGIERGPADLSLTKRVSSANVLVNSNFSFTITVSNGGPSTATNVKIKDVLPLNVTFQSISSNATYASGIISITDPIASGSSVAVILTVRSSLARTYTNCAEIYASDQTDTDSTPNNNSTTEDDDDCTSVTVQSLSSVVDLQVTKTGGSGTFNIGTNFTYTVTVRNLGGVTATNVNLTEQFNGQSFVSATPSQGTYDSTNHIWSVGTLAANATATLSITLSVTDAFYIENCANLQSSTPTDANITNNNACVSWGSVSSYPNAYIDISKTATPQAVAPGNTVTFTIRLAMYPSSNPNGTVASGIVVTDLLPVGATYVSHSTATGTYDPQSGIWLPGNITITGSTTQIRTLNIVATIAQDVINCASFTMNNPSPGYTGVPNACVTIYANNHIDLQLLKGRRNGSEFTPETSQNLSLGGTTTMQIQVQNVGAVTATGVNVKDLLPTGLIVSNASACTGYNTTTNVWAVGTLLGGEVKDCLLTISSNTPGTYQNCAEVFSMSGADVDSTPNNLSPTEDDYSCSTVVVIAPDLSLSKSVVSSGTKSTIIDKGSVVDFIISVNNDSASTIPFLPFGTDIEVKDILPAGTVYLSHTCSSGSSGVCNTVTYNPTTGIIRQDNGTAVNFTLTIKAIVFENVTNCAEIVTSPTDADSTPNNNSTNEDDDDCAEVLLRATCDPSMDILTNEGFEDLGTAGTSNPIQGTPADWLNDNINAVPSWSAVVPSGSSAGSNGVYALNATTRPPGDPFAGDKYIYLWGTDQCVAPYSTSLAQDGISVTAGQVYIVCTQAAAWNNNTGGTQGTADFAIETIFKNSSTSATTTATTYARTAPANTGGWNDINWNQYCATFIAPTGYDRAIVYFSGKENVDGTLIDNVCIELGRHGVEQRSNWHYADRQCMYRTRKSIFRPCSDKNS